MTQIPQSTEEGSAYQLYQQAVLEQSLEFDKQLIWLAGGAIALITALISAVRPELGVWQRPLLVSGLALLLASLAITLSSLQISISDAGAILAGADDADRKRRESRMRGLNYTSLALFVAGVAVFMWFAVSISEGGAMSGSKPQPGNGMPSSVPTKQGTPPAPKPTPPPKEGKQ